MWQNWVLQKTDMLGTIKELLEVLGSNFDVDTVLEHIQNNPNYGNSNFSSQQQSELATELSLRTPNPKMFIKKYEDMKNRNLENLPGLIALFYNLLCEEKKAKSMKPKVAPKPHASENKHTITKDDLPQIRDKLLKAVDEGKKIVLKTFDEKETRHKLDWCDSLNLPGWLSERHALSWNFPREKATISGSLAAIPMSSQEYILIDDLLYVFEGLPGIHIVPQGVKEIYEPRSFIVSEEVDLSLKQIILQILPLASHYSIILTFVEKSNMWSGKVIHALVSAIQTLLKDYYMMIAQLENEHLAGNLTLQKLWYFILPTMHTMEIVAGVAKLIGQAELRGGAVLSVLHDKTNSHLGDSKAQEICLYLIEKASLPYMHILHQWIHRGNVNDPFQEFMIEDNEVIKKEVQPVDYSADYWEKRYTVQRDRIPKFLDKFADIILRTGKYLNVISQCGKSRTFSDAEEIKYSLREQHYAAGIQKAYTFASKSLLELLLKEYDLMGRLKSVKQYFLMEQGDFIVQFMDASEQELLKNIGDIMPTKLESLLGLCLRLSAACHDPYSEDMRTDLLEYNLQFQMCKILSIQTDEEKEYKQNKERLPLTGIDTFSFAMDVKWPVSLILNHKAIACYQMIFRHLFYCKHVERLLCRVWLANKVAKRFAEGRQYAAAFALRQRMLSCVQHLQYYMCVEVLEPSWCTFIASLAKVSNVDEVLERHSDFLECCLGDCMLTNPKLLQAVTMLCSVCLRFCAFIQKMRKYYVDAELNDMIGSSYDPMSESYEGTTCGGGESHASEMGSSFDKSVAHYDMCFTAALISMLGLIGRLDNNTDKLLNLMARLNFNTFYSEQLERLCENQGLNSPSPSTTHTNS